MEYVRSVTKNLNKKEILADLVIVQRDYYDSMMGRMIGNLESLINRLTDDINGEKVD